MTKDRTTANTVAALDNPAATHLPGAAATLRHGRCMVAHRAAHVREPIPGTEKVACECKACGHTWIEKEGVRDVTG